MGNGESRISNAGPFPIQVKIFQDEERIKETETTVGASINIGGKAGTKVGAKLEKVEAEASKEVSANFGADFKEIKKGTVAYVDPDFKGFRMIGPQESLDVTSSVDANENNYISIFAEISDGVYYNLLMNWKIKGEIRICVGVTDEGHFASVFDPKIHLAAVELCEKPKTWRCKGGKQNYYAPFVCLHCNGRVSCTDKECPDYKEYGGHFKQTW